MWSLISVQTGIPFIDERLELNPLDERLDICLDGKIYPRKTHFFLFFNSKRVSKKLLPACDQEYSSTQVKTIF